MGLFIAGTGTIRRAPVGTAAPTDLAAPAAAWVNLGETSDDGLQATPQVNIVEHATWQSGGYPARRQRTTNGFRVSFEIANWNAVNVTFAMGGGTWTETTAGSGVWKFQPQTDVLPEWALLFDVVDGAATKRYLIPKGNVVDFGEVSYGRENLAVLPVTFDTLGSTGVAPWQLIANTAAVPQT
jgi:hypothetical protein